MFAMFGLGVMEIMVIGGVALLLFGNRLPGAMRSLGQGILEFKKGMNDTVEGTELEGSAKPQIEDTTKSKP